MVEINLTKENFQNEVLNSEKPVLVDFWATWCGPCRMLAPVLAEIAEEHQERIKVCKVNVDEQRDLAINYQISSIPTLILFKDGEIINTVVGFQSKSELEKMIQF